ncbi:MAG: class I SAM-dependent methyltransferase [Prevotellaceae bacterium]|jgi:23S rRNA (cytosine1962-C5)-methyltransferase|nr:class I SAM-dependent methyltransferase [Prevotellaceae bacterium]
MLLFSPNEWADYELIDTGGFEKLERFGDFVLARPEPKAVWKKTLSEKEWTSLMHTRFTTGAGFGKSGKEDSGSWQPIKKMQEQWFIGYRCIGLNMRMRLGLTAFKHVGIFPEQAPNWDYIYSSVKGLNVAEPKVLNLFAYTGGASLAAKAAGADVVHLDSVRQVVSWARENMALSGLNNIRWVVEDALRFVKREAKRGNLYQGIMLDPPAYGHGTDGEKWKLDECLLEMLQYCRQILASENSFLILNLYSNGFSALVADTVIRNVFGKMKEQEYGELFLEDRFEKRLPLSVFARFKR